MAGAGRDRRDWSDGATKADAFKRGVIEAPSVPTFVVAASFVGFGALGHDVGLTLVQSVFLGVTTFALPGQVVLLDQLAQGATLAATAFAVTLTAVRLLPLTVSLMPTLRAGRGIRPVDFVHAHFIAITVYLESMRRLPMVPGPLRGAYYAGFTFGVIVTCALTTAIGYGLAASLAPAISAGLIFLTPIYFFLSLLKAAENIADNTALVIGGLLGPVLFVVLPGLDLLMSGLIGGTAAYVLLRLKGDNG